MPSLKQEQRTRTLAELDLRPEERAELSAMLDTYSLIEVDFDACEHQLGIEQSKIGKFLADRGFDKVSTDLLNLCWVRGSTTTKLMKEKLLAQGVTLAQIEAATVTKPKKDYFQIRNSKKGAPSYEE